MPTAVTRAAAIRSSAELAGSSTEYDIDPVQDLRELIGRKPPHALSEG
jgi:hypothetical protein